MPSTSSIIITMNVRELLHFFEVRTCNRAQDEIRVVADEMVKALLRRISYLILQMQDALVLDVNVLKERCLVAGDMKRNNISKI